MKKTVVYLLMVSMCLFAAGGVSGCKKSVPPEEMTEPAEVAKTDAAVEEAEVVSGDAGAKIDLRILYAGLPDTDRQKDFVKFLSGHFEKVKVGDYLNFKAEQADGFDVVILDHDGVDEKAPRPDVPRDYSRATVTMGVPGADICSRLDLKTGYS
jgi:hypothetical protein